ncbi:MAG: hypothetical protein AB7R89_25775 [Dehalococcoidia bacterium]
MTCPHCGTPLTAHIDGDRYHCNIGGCGCCFNTEGRVREGHPPCGKPAIHPFAPPLEVGAEELEIAASETAASGDGAAEDDAVTGSETASEPEEPTRGKGRAK